MKTTLRLLSLGVGLAHPAQANELLINNVTVVSAHLEQAEPGQSLRIVDGVITEIATKPFIPGTTDVTVIEGQGQYLTPGIMDSHVHVGTIPGIGFLGTEQANSHAPLVKAYLAQQPRSLLYFGVTQVLNLGDSEGAADFTRGTIHPDYFTCQPVPVVGGYPHLSAAFTLAHAAYFILENGQTVDLPEGIDPAAHSVASVVEAIAKTGTPCIKIYIEDGFGNASDWPMLSSATLTQIRREADKFGLQVWAHANAIDMYSIALKHRVDGIAHGMWNWQWPADPDNPSVTQTLDNVMASKTAYMPTIQVMLALQGMYDEKTLSDPRRQKVLPAALLN